MNPESPAFPAFAPPLKVGIFDSGVGGLSVLRAVRSALPQAELLYAADAAHVPYGDRSEEFIVERSERIARFLQDQGARLLVVACNTATAAAVAALRRAHDAPPIVGVEPGIKPALSLSRKRRVGVLATTRTLGSEKFRRLAEAHAGDAHLVLQACPGLADAIEAASTPPAELADLVERYCAPLRAAGVDVAVLGCTHYPFALDLFERSLPGVTLVDTAQAVARQAARLAEPLLVEGPTPPAAHAREAGTPCAPTAAATTPPPHSAPPTLRAWTSGDPRALAEFARRWLNEDVDVRPMAA